MKLKYYLRGLGIGILVSTIILMIAFSRHPREMSDQEIISRAQELGMVMEQGKTGESIPKGTETAGAEKQDTQQAAEMTSTESDGQPQEGTEGTEQPQDVPSAEGIDMGEADTQMPEDTEKNSLNLRWKMENPLFQCAFGFMRRGLSIMPTNLIPI